MQIEPRIPSTAIPPESSTYESVARSNQCGSSEQIIHTETRCVTETMVRLEHKSPQPDFQSDLQLTVPTVKPVEPNAHAIDSHRAYTHKTHPLHVDRVVCDAVNVENVRAHERREHMAAHSDGPLNEVGTKRLVQKDVYVAPRPINDGYQVYQSANVPPLLNGRLSSPEKSHARAFLRDATNYELKAPALVSSIASQSLANGHLPNGKCDHAAAKTIIETESMDAWSMHKHESTQIDVADAAPNALPFTPHTHAIKPIYHNRFNHTESKHYNNIIPKLDSRHDATPMQTHKKVRIHTIASYNCLLLVH